VEDWRASWGRRGTRKRREDEGPQQERLSEKSGEGATSEPSIGRGEVLGLLITSSADPKSKKVRKGKTKTLAERKKKNYEKMGF